MITISQDNFQREVMDSPQVVLVNFWAPWCGLCLMLQPILNRLESQWCDDLKIVSINADQNFRLANNYRLRNLPTLILFHGGEVIQRLEGFRSREDLYTTVNNIMLTLGQKIA